jgi:hypothetical protein
VLKRDGTNVVQDSSCAAVSGRWYSPYDGATWTLASDVDIDHVVPLSNAWKVTKSTTEGFRLVSRWSLFLSLIHEVKNDDSDEPELIDVLIIS